MEEETDPQPHHLEPEQEVTESLRSRASSVISTGTQISILTLPQSDSASQRNIDGIVNDPTATTAPRLVPRPMSIYSFRSMGEALPPYSEHQLLPAGGEEGAEERPQTSYHLPSSNTGDVHQGHGGRIGEAVEAMEEADDLPPVTPTSERDPENAIARHYGTVVRTIDENNARLIASMKVDHAQELATMRNAIDGEYRKVLKARNNELERNREVSATRESELEAQIEELKDQLEGAKLETAREVERVTGEKDAEIDERCAKARHLVEDLWEERWQKRNELAAEESKRSEREWKETIRVVVDQEREKWGVAVEKRHGSEELEILERAVEEGDVGDSEKTET